MKRHRFDPLSFVFGVIFLLIAGAAAWDQSFRWDINAWILPGAVLVLGIGLLASTLRSGSGDSRAEDTDLLVDSAPES